MKLRHLATAAALLVISARAGSAQVITSTTQDVTITVTSVDQISVTGGTIAISVGVGSTPNTDATYSITTNSTTNRVIKGQLDSDLPSGVSLTANLAAPSTGTSAGAQPLVSSSAATLVSAIHNVTGSSLQITYIATATVSATPAATTRTITYTIQ